MSLFRKYVQAPYGTFSGRWPNDAASRLHEHRLSADLARHVGGAVEVVLLCGRADVATNSDIFEVEPIDNWRHGLQQVLAYSAETGLRPNLALFGERGDASDIYLKLRDRTHSRVTLWLHDRYQWGRITNRRAASRRVRAERSEATS